MEIWIPAANIEPLKTKLEVLARDARRAGQPFAVSVERTGRCESRMTPVLARDMRFDAHELVPWVEIRVAGDLNVAPGHDGWRVLAVARADDSGAVLVHGREINAWRPTAPFHCEDCGVANGRRALYRIAGPDGSVRVVGSTCARAYLPNGLTAEHLLDAAKLLWQAREAIEDAEDIVRGAPKLPTLPYFLAQVAAQVRTDRGSFATARQAEIDGTASTARMAWERALDGDAIFPTDPADLASGRELAAWAYARLDQLQAEGASDYERNVGAVVEAGHVSARTAGLAASLWAMREREARDVARAVKPKPTRFAGEVGARVKGADVTVERISSYESAYGTRFILTLRTAEHVRLVWFTADPGLAFAEARDNRATIKVDYTPKTINVLSRYDGEIETIVSRVSEAKAPKAPRKVAA